MLTRRHGGCGFTKGSRAHERGRVGVGLVFVANGDADRPERGCTPCSLDTGTLPRDDSRFVRPQLGSGRVVVVVTGSMLTLITSGGRKHNPASIRSPPTLNIFFGAIDTGGSSSYLLSHGVYCEPTSTSSPSLVGLCSRELPTWSSRHGVGGQEE